MSVESTRQTMQSYLDALVSRGDYAAYFTDDVQWTTMGVGQEVKGRQAVGEFISWFHTQAFDAQPQLKNLVVGDGQAMVEFEFVGTHTGEFLGIPPTGKSVSVPYCVAYDLRGDKIASLRGYMAMELFSQQLNV